MTEFEIEKKALITEEKYKKFSDVIDNNIITQINYYYDTDSHTLFNNGDTLRVRQIEEELQLQYKHKIKMHNAIRLSKEFIENIEILPKTIVIDGMETNYIGFLLTERTTIKANKHTVFLDKNYYLGKVDYEIEIEAAHISDIPKMFLGDELETTSSGKYTRFLNELMGNNKMYEVQLNCSECQNTFLESLM